MWGVLCVLLEHPNDMQPLFGSLHVRVVRTVIAAVKGVIPIRPSRSFNSRQLYVG